MPGSRPDLEKRRCGLIDRIAHLGDFRPGSITATRGRCGNPNCNCHKPDDPRIWRAVEMLWFALLCTGPGPQ